MLTRRGWSLVGAAVGLYIGARLLGLVQLAVLAHRDAARCSSPRTSGCDSTRPRCTRAPRPEGALQVGVDGRVDLDRRRDRPAHADARGRRRVRPRPPRRPLPARRRSRPARKHAPRTASPPIGAAASKSARCARRSPTRSASRRRPGACSRTEEVIVYPRVHDIIAPPEIGGLDLDRDHPRVRSRVEPSGDFMTLRDYAPGDDLRHVHWRSTRSARPSDDAPERNAPARAGARDARRAARRARPRVVRARGRSVRVDRDRARPRGPAVRGRCGAPGTLVGAPGRRHLANVMDELAVVEPHGPTRSSSPRRAAAAAR